MLSISQLTIEKPCNICNKKNDNTLKNICTICCKLLTPHFDNCSCIYCRWNIWDIIYKNVVTINTYVDQNKSGKI